ncbi:MAG: hypothetical protein HOP02_10210 [Methylococcaceae bacterium]|nr:hypothetical protein [Methylococcaceae bacterium]
MQKKTFMRLTYLLLVFSALLSASTFAANSSVSTKIPDNFALGIISTLRFDKFALLDNLKVSVHIAPPRIGDLLVQLQCPNGHLVTLHNRVGGTRHNLNVTYHVSDCENIQVAGDWKLRISDNVQGAAGSLLSWTMHSTAHKSTNALFHIGSIKGWTLIGNAITPGDNQLNVQVETLGKVESLAVSIDKGSTQALTATGAGFAALVDISQLPPGEHTLSLTANDSQTPFATLPFQRSHPLYVLMTTDWDSADSADSILRLHDKLHVEHPVLKFTHFFAPYTFTDPSVTPTRRAELVDWLLRLARDYQDEIGLHIHPFCNFVNTVPGVRCRFKPSDSYDKGDPTGYTVLSSAYSEQEYLQLLKAADALFTAHGLGKPTAFRTGSWAANAGTLKALVTDGFVVDSSANNWARIDEAQHEDNSMLWKWNRQHWRPINDTSQPYYPNTENPALANQPVLPILEIPDNGSLVDYVTGTEMIDIFNANWVGRPLVHPTTFVMGFHPVSYGQGFHQRIEKALAHIDYYLAATGEGPVVYESASHVAKVFGALRK